MKNPKILVISGGFFYFGDFVESPEEGYLGLKSAAMFGGFSSPNGVPGITRGSAGSTVKLDRFADDEIQMFPVESCYGILSCINLYEFKGAEVR